MAMAPRASWRSGDRRALRLPVAGARTLPDDSTAAAPDGRPVSRVQLLVSSQLSADGRVRPRGSPGRGRVVAGRICPRRHLYVSPVPRGPCVLTHDAGLLPHGPARLAADDLDSWGPAAVLWSAGYRRSPADRSVEYDDRVDCAARCSRCDNLAVLRFLRLLLPGGCRALSRTE